MPLFGKRNPNPAPGWALPLTAEQYQRFVETIRRVLDEMQVPGDREPRSDGTMSIRNQQGEESRLGLQNLAQLVAANPLDRWTPIAREHLVNVINPVMIPGDRDAILPLLRIRFWPPEYFERADKASCRSLAPGLALGLALDLPTTVASVNPEQLRDWNLSEDEAWSRAELNTANEPFEVLSTPGPGGTIITLIVAKTFYASANALWLDRHVTINPDRGALVAIPTRHLVGAHPIDDFGVVHAVSGMIESSRRLYSRGPGSITPELYWWRQGTFTHIPSSDQDGKTAIMPPGSFVELVNSLKPAA